MAQQREVLDREKETAEKIAARAFAQQYLADLLPSVYTTLRDHGYFYDPVERGRLPPPSPPGRATALHHLHSTSAITYIRHFGTQRNHKILKQKKTVHITI